MHDLVCTGRLQSFEAFIGVQCLSLRGANSGEREEPSLAKDGSPANTRKSNLKGQPALRELFGTARGLPLNLAQGGLDHQPDLFRDKSKTTFGSCDIAIFSDREKAKS
ncbi:hypothetical protein ACFMBG_01485 [Leisingera sp. D0M16]|uniref:hypothetical protein n=1 Tax=Leisingera coralii TaxID=3351347 RepID=UPI003B77DFF8